MCHNLAEVESEDENSVLKQQDWGVSHYDTMIPAQ